MAECLPLPGTSCGNRWRIVCLYLREKNSLDVANRRAWLHALVVRPKLLVPGPILYTVHLPHTPSHGVDKVFEVGHGDRVIALRIKAPRARVESEPPLEVILDRGLLGHATSQNRKNNLHHSHFVATPLRHKRGKVDRFGTGIRCDAFFSLSSMACGL